MEGAFDISSSESSSIIFRIVSSRSLLEGRVDLGLGFEAVVEGMKSSSCSDSEASRIGSVGVFSGLLLLMGKGSEENEEGGVG